MVLGEIYMPKGLARETAQVVMNVVNPHAVNVAVGCSNKCRYCYVARRYHLRKDLSLPQKPPVLLVAKQLEKGLDPDGVFISFLTDPFLDQTRKLTEPLIELLLDQNIRVATLSKMGLSLTRNQELRGGMTIVSTDPKFWRTWEPNALDPKKRIQLLEHENEIGFYTWVSIEPYPTPALWEQDILDLLEEIKFVDLIIFGKWNYEPLATGPDAEIAYRANVHDIRDFCRSHGIRLHIKADTLRFIGAKQ